MKVTNLKANLTLTRLLGLLALAPLCLLAVVTPNPASATGGCVDGPLATGIWEVTLGDAGDTYYLADHGLGHGTWLYEESNFVWTPKPAGVYHYAPGEPQGDLQEGGSSAFVPGDNAVCTDLGDWAPDTMIL